MPVRPREQPIERLSYNGETAEGGGQGMKEDETKDDDSAGDVEEAEEESRTAIGETSPKEPTKKQREDHGNTHTCHIGVGARIV